MRTKNHIKSPTQDSLRGIGKLDYTEGSAVNSIVKRLIGSFNNDESVTPAPSTIKKEPVVCPQCKQKFKLNNPTKIPNHRPGWRNRYGNGDKICKGSWSRQKSENTVTHQLEKIWSGLGELKVGDKILIDFSRTALQSFDTRYTDVFETTITKIEKIDTLCNDNTVLHWQEKIYFDNVEKPIFNSLSFLNHMMKI